MTGEGEVVNLFHLQSEWCQLNSPRVGLFWFNKFSGETRRDIPAGAPSDQRYSTCVDQLGTTSVMWMYVCTCVDQGLHLYMWMYTVGI